MNTRKKIVWIAARACLILIFMMLATACRKLETLSSGNESGAYTAITPEEETPPAPPAETTPAPQETQQQTPAPPADTTPGNLIPGTNIPSTGNPQLDAQLAENQKHSSTVNPAIGNEHGEGYTDQGADLNWN